MDYVQILNTLVLFYAYLCPYTKVEESFNIQASHDILFFSTNISQYDHLAFPGVVPRTFTAPLYLDVIIYPLFYLISSYIDKFYFQLIFRALLGTLLVRSFACFANAVSKSLSSEISLRFLAITASQFHLPFYMSRPLPNVFALCLTMHSLTAFIKGDELRFLAFSGFAMLVFRSELALFFGPIFILALYYRIVKLRWQLFLYLGIITFHSVVMTVSVDSFFWQRVVWPEAEVFYYNTILNKSHNWGTLPFYWYFTTVLPKTLLLTNLLFFGWILIQILSKCKPSLQAQIGPKENKITNLGLCSLIFVVVYSFLPHKELRFVIYALPIFNLNAAAFWKFIEKNFKCDEHFSSKKTFRILTLVYCYIHILINFLLTVLFLIAAYYNYPGGQAIRQLNLLNSLKGAKNVHIHISNAAAQSGVTRFLEQHKDWIYNKTEGIENEYNLSIHRHFTHILFDEYSTSPLPDSKTFKKLFEISAYKRFAPFEFRFVFEGAISVYERISWVKSQT